MTWEVLEDFALIRHAALDLWPRFLTVVSDRI